MIGILTTDARLIVRSWDERLAEMTGIAAGDAIGRHVGDLAPDLAERGLLARFENVLNQGVVAVLAPAFHHYLFRCPPSTPANDFDVMQQHVIIAPLRTEERVVGTIVTIEDVTSRIDPERTRTQQLNHAGEPSRVAAPPLPMTADGVAPELVARLGDSSWTARRSVVEQLSETADARSIAQVLGALRSEHHNPAVLNSALQVLALSRIDVIPALLEFLHGPDVDLRIYAALALGAKADQRAVMALLDALHDPEQNVVFHAIESLGRLRAQAAVEQLAEFATSGDFFLAFPALTALTQIGDSSVAERLLPLLDDELLGEAAADALSQLGDLAVVGPLAQLLNQHDKSAATVCRAIVNLYDRYRQRYGQAGYVVSRVRRTVEGGTVDRLITLLNTADHDDLRPLAHVLGWLEGTQIDAALCALLRHDTLRDELGDICVQRGPALVEHLLEQLASGDLEARATIVDVLGRIGDHRATPPLRALLQGEPELLIAAVDALARTGDRSVFEPLLALIGHAELDVRQAVIAAINSLGHPDTSERLPALMRHPNPLVRDSAVRIAGYYGFPECAGALLACAADADERVRLAAIEQLPFVGDGQVLPAFLLALRQDTPRVRAAAARAGGFLDDPEVAPALLAACEDSAPWVRYHAVRSLATGGTATAFEVLGRLIEHDPAPHVRIAALEAFGALGREQAIDVLATLVSAEDLDVACAALTGLGATRSGRALPALRSALRASEPRRRVAAITALAELGAGDAVEVLQWVAAVDRDATIAARAITALGELRSSQAIAALLGLLAEPARRDPVCDALVRLGPGHITEIALGLHDPDPAIRRAVVEILARMGHLSTWHALDAALEDPDAAVRLAAVHGLAGLNRQDVTTRLGFLAATDEDALVRRAARTLLER